MERLKWIAMASAAVAVCAGAAKGDGFAASVASYEAGAGAVAGFTDPGVAVGSPTRVSGFDLRVTPFNPPFQSSEVVSIGKGGHLTLEFESLVTDDPGNPFGIDMIVFSNAFFYAEDFSAVAEHVWKPGGLVEVSLDGDDWRAVTGAVADGVFPTLGFRDTTDPFGSDGGLVPTNFRVPVDPAFSPWGKTFDELRAGYGVSGGGTGIDLAGTGLSAVRYVRISNPGDALYAIEIDAAADVVPAPAAMAMAAVGAIVMSRRRR
ncbi:MAG: hypothetical protein GIKADHBN_01529 [Phycisphaerales bacterium]|nr:hypothetical protein [Phycisphaerales bacterium]